MAEISPITSPAGTAARQSNVISNFRNRVGNFLNDLPQDLDSAERLVLAGIVTINGANIIPGNAAPAAFDGENNHLDVGTLAAAVGAIQILRLQLDLPRIELGGVSIRQVFSAIPR